MSRIQNFRDLSLPNKINLLHKGIQLPITFLYSKDVQKKFKDQYKKTDLIIKRYPEPLLHED